MFYEAMLERLQDVDVPDEDFRGIQEAVQWDRWELHIPPAHGHLIHDLQHMADGHLARAHLFELSGAASDADWAAAPAISFFLGVMMWGYSGDGRGPWRTARALEHFGAVVNSLHMVRAHLLEGNVPAMDRLAHAFGVAQARPGRIPWVGVSFFTKLMHFLAYDQMDQATERPLIFDHRVCLGLMRLATPFENTEEIITLAPPESPAAYALYCQWMHRWAEALGVASDRLERFFFVRGG